MAKSNVEIVTTGLDVLLAGLRPYVLRELKSRYGDRWWKAAVEDALRPFGVRIGDLPITPQRLVAMIRAATGGTPRTP